ncbi:hypothetical protein GIB67_012372 [Kingdonia uniflora]|uniref:Uncharacterized protein n=1 Tax=Kingdonia uniflora TaxID=39325 RepID=A0A7J7L4F1_9MAGN|nr:hypothetical protein GIB67_012372 [Kingdonia uniflora]
MSSSPEFQAPPKIYYNDTEARKYTSSSHMVHTQVKISFYLDTANKLQTNNQSFSSYKWKFSVRALELLGLPHHGLPRLLLDISNNNIYLYLLLLKANLDFVHSSMSLSHEFQAPLKIYYNDTEARKYTSSSHMVETQVIISF